MGNQQATNRPRRWTVHVALVSVSAILASLLAGCGGGGSSGTSAAQQGSQTSAAPTTTVPTTQASTTTTTAPAGTHAPTTTPTQTQTTQQQAPPNERIVLTSSAIDPEGGALQARYTCDGQDTPLPLKWTGVPPGTAELMIDVIKVKPVDNKLFFAWAVTHIDPATHEIKAGKLPSGAIVGTNGSGQTGYSLCPPKGPSEAYVAVIFALPHELSARPGFDPAPLRLQAEHKASYQNLLIFNYTRR
jgi:phosphatidylethanolamine-binding protein (PEBP) family uncharacterized protein